MALAVALSCCLPTYAAETPTDATTTLAVVLVNGRQAFDTRELLVSADGDVWLSVEDWASIKGLALDLADFTGLVSARQLGIEPEFDAGQQAYDLKVPARMLPRQRMTGSRAARAKDVAPQPKGALINYDLAASLDDRGNTVASLAHDARVGIGAGTLVATGQVNTTHGGVDYVRGSTTWHYDHLPSGTAVAIGDVFTPRTQLSGPVGLAGVRIGSDRGLRADEDFLPVPSIGGIADTRTAAEIWVNERRVGQGSVNAGPWDLGSVPALPGSNDIRIVLRDQFGREEVVSQRFYLTSKLLPSGQSEWQVSLGAVRQGQDDYATPALAATYERGATAHWTVGGSIQATDEATNVGLSNRIALGAAGVLTIDTAKSSSPRGAGTAVALSYDYRGRNWGTSLTHSRYSENYWQLSHERGQAGLDMWQPKSSTTASLSVAPRGGPWSVSAAAAQIEYHNGRSRDRVDLSARYRFGSNELAAGLGRDLDSGDQSAYLTFRHSFDNGTRVSATARRAPDPTYQVQASGKAHLGNQAVRWVASAEDRPAGTRIRGQAFTVLEKGDLSVGLEHDQRGTRVQGRFQGSVWVGEGGVSAQRTARGSFALVEVPGQEGVPVSGVGGFAGRTNRNGVAIVPAGQALVPTPVKIDTTELPAEVRVDSSGKVIHLPRRGGGKVVFDVLSEQVVQLTITTDGKAIEPPALAKTDQEEAIVGHGGVLVLMSAKPGQEVQVRHSSGTCTVVLPDLLPSIGEATVLPCEVQR